MKATFWRQLTPGTTYWRCEVPAGALPGRVIALDHCDLAPDKSKPANADGDFQPCFPRQVGDAAIWQFSGNRTRALLMAGMRQIGLRVLVEADDNYLIDWPGRRMFDTGWKTTAAESTNDEHNIEIHKAIVQKGCDGVICSTEYLASYYREVCPKDVFVCPNSIEPSHWPELPPRDDGILRIGWAGSVSHTLDHHLVRRALRWASKQPGVEVWLIGFDPADSFDGWNFAYKKLPWADSVTDYFKNLAEAKLDVGICAVAANQWSRSKSDVKALEYAMAGAMPICSEIECYSPWREQAALFARSAKDFERAIEWCVLHRDEIPQLAREAKDYVLKERTIQSNIWRWEEAIVTQPDDGINR